MNQTFSAHGKLLLTGEYVIIDGALSLATPTKRGQHMSVSYTDSGKIKWESYDDKNNCWFWVDFTSNLQALQTSDQTKAAFLAQLLSHCFAQTNSTIAQSILNGAEIQTRLDFPTDWGLGSSSTLLVLLSKLFDIDAFDVHFSHTNGSGYDIACGLSSTPITYQLIGPKTPEVRAAHFNPSFAENLFFVHLNQKQYSTKEVAQYKAFNKTNDLTDAIAHVSQLTREIILCNSLTHFEELLETHEVVLSHILQRNTIREDLFQMYKKGAIKSLGAWGGDFVLVTGTYDDLDYFRDKGFSTIITYHDMIPPFDEFG
jgi:mevalonate kinase